MGKNMKPSLFMNSFLSCILCGEPTVLPEKTLGQAVQWGLNIHFTVNVSLEEFPKVSRDSGPSSEETSSGCNSGIIRDRALY